MTNNKADDTAACAAAIAKLRPLLWKKSYTTWSRLSPDVRFWIDVEDIYQDAQLVAVRCWHRWDPERGAFITLVYLAVDCRLSNLLARYQCKKRHAVLVPLEDATEQLQSYYEPWTDAVLHEWIQTLQQRQIDFILEYFNYDMAIERR